jgi:hypothetical protein
MDWIVRSDVILLGLMLVGVVAIAIHVSYRLSRGRRDLLGDRRRRQLAADLGAEVAMVGSIIVVAPYLGLVGACFATFGDFNGIGVEAESGFAAIAPRLPLCFVTTAIGTMVAIAATCVHIYLVFRLDSLRRERCVDDRPTKEHSRRAVKFPLSKRFSGLPAYALIAAPTFAFLAVANSPYVDPCHPTGFAVDLETAPYDVRGRWMVLHVTEQDKVFLNFETEDWRTLPNRLAEIYRLRADRTICLVADENVRYQKVMDAIDAVESVGMPDGERIRVRLITPKAMGGCAVPYALIRLTAK